MSNKIDQLFKRAFQREQFEYKDSYFEALVEGGLPIRKSFLARNKWLLLTVVPLLLIGTSTMAYIGYQKVIAGKEQAKLEQASGALMAQNDRPLATELDASQTTSPTQNAYTARKTNTSADPKENRSTSVETQSPEQGVGPETNGGAPVASKEEMNGPAIVGSGLTTSPNVLKHEKANSHEAATASLYHSSSAISTQEAQNNTKTHQGENSIGDKGLVPRYVNNASATGSTSEVASASLTESASNSNSSGLATDKPSSEKHSPRIEQYNNKGMEVATSLSLVQEETAGTSSNKNVQQTGEKQTEDEEANLQMNAVLSTSNTEIETTAEEEPEMAEETPDIALEEFLDSSNVVLVDSVENASEINNEEQLVTVHPAETFKSSWFVGLSTDYNFFSKTPIGEDPFKKYMRLRIAGESPNNNLSYGFYAKRSGPHLSYTTGLQLGRLSEDVVYIGSRKLYDVVEVFDFYGDSLNATPGEDPDGSTLIAVSYRLDSTLKGEVDTVLSEHTNRVNYLQIPFTVGYHHQIGRFTAEVQGGINLMYAYSINGYYMHESREFSNPLSEHFSRFSMSPMLGLEVNYQLNNNWMLGSRMSYRIPNTRFSPDTRFTWKQTSLGVNLSYRFR